jgi:hypothetical protein
MGADCSIGELDAGLGGVEAGDSGHNFGVLRYQIEEDRWIYRVWRVTVSSQNEEKKVF